MDRLSSEGLHLESPGKISNRYIRDPSNRYMYRLDYRTDLRSSDELRDFLDLFRDALWTHIGNCLNWHYFRRKWAPGKTPEIYSDRESLKSHYKRIRRVLGVVFLAELPVLFINANNLLVQPAGRRALPFSAAGSAAAAWTSTLKSERRGPLLSKNGTGSGQILHQPSLIL